VVSIVVSLIALVLIEVVALSWGVVSFRHHDPDHGYMALMGACFAPLLFLLNEGSPLYGVLPNNIDYIIAGVCLVLFLLVVGLTILSLRSRRQR
jgi:uncharacterized membrane protein YuzA (DUF378 family)